MQIEFKNFRTGGRTEFFTLVLVGVAEIHGCSWKTGEKDGKPYAFVALPQRSYEANGEKRYTSDIVLDKPLSWKIADAYKAHKGLGGHPTPTPDNDAPPPFDEDSIPF